jgi:hypothetical protein
MKNVKKTVATAIVISTLTFGSSIANAGIIMSKNSERQQCTAASSSKTGFMSRVAGIILEGIIMSKTGIIMSKEGIIMSKENSTKCDSRRTTEGIIMS